MRCHETLLKTVQHVSGYTKLVDNMCCLLYVILIQLACTSANIILLLTAIVTLQRSSKFVFFTVFAVYSLGCQTYTRVVSDLLDIQLKAIMVI